ncbi:MAG: trigger factor [Oscillospiraceae bacterium]|jgi:trigger factor|nr:trigger factor [Oscillospiraceae bacterium]
MSLIAKEKTAPATWKVTAHIAAEDFCAQLDKTFAKQLPNIALPGFRKGKAPRAMVEKRYGENIFFEEALEALLPGQISAALEEAQLEPLYRAEELDVQEMDKAQGVSYSFVVAVKPEITIGEYRGLSVAVPPARVAPADVDARIHELQHRNARQVEVEGRAAQNGDIAVIDFLGLLDGTPFEGGSAENHELQLGTGQFIPGFEEQVVGHMPGDKFDVNVTFPEDYHAEELAGKPVVFQVTLHELKEEELPEVDDDFAQEVGEDYNTVEELRAGVEKELSESRAKAAEDAFEKGVREHLAALVEGEIPQAMIARRVQRNVELFEERLQLPLERYCEFMGMEMESFLERMEEQSANQVKVELALEAIAAAEGFMPTDDEIEAEYQRLADEYKVPLANAKFGVPREEIQKDLQREKAMALVQSETLKVTQEQETAAQEE